ncbi:MAG: 4Fe-4S binding protein [Muribaculaceae bacterium]|nr:4Fe-4S binding protein [Muribaculaceae bacterium]
MYVSLKNTRIAISVGLVTVAFFAAAATTTGIAVNAGWICKIQIITLILSGSIPLIAGWLLLTFVFGRIYCSTVCPLGTMQDMISYIARRTTQRKHRYRFRRPHNGTRSIFLLITAGGIIIGNGLIVTLLDPFFNFNIIVEGTIMPVCTLGAAAVGAGIAAEAIITLAIITCISGRAGRLLCNTVCPVGTTLGVISRYSVMRMDINTDLCTGCLKCVDVCKSSCIDSESHTIDTSRCVVCMNCAAACPNNAIAYTSSRHRLQKPLMAT